jgi:hypothetical protein
MEKHLFWDNKLWITGSLLLVKSPGKTRTSEENVDRIKEAFQRSLRCMRCPNYHVKLSSNKMGRRHISDTTLGITWTQRWLGDGSAEVD